MATVRQWYENTFGRFASLAFWSTPVVALLVIKSLFNVTPVEMVEGVLRIPTILYDLCR